MKFKIKQSGDKESIIEYLNKLSGDKEFEVTITPIKKKRSVSQNSLYHMWLNCIAKETGEDVECLHKYFASKYLGYKTIEVMGETMQVIVSTTKLTTQEFTDYLDQITMFAETELSIVLPNPDDRFYEQFEELYGRE